MGTPKNYNSEFYQSQVTDSVVSAEVIVPLLFKYFNFKSAIDVGCGVGAWLSVLRKHGVEEITGLDSGNVPADTLMIDKENFRITNLNEEIKLERRFDLVCCLEVAEHLEPARADGLVRDLVELGDIVLFSAAIPGQEGTGHLNEQYPSYWIDKFKRHGFTCLDIIRPVFWNDTRICMWYKQNTMLFMKPGELSKYPLIEQQFSFQGADLVHPDYFHHKTVRVDRLQRIAENPLLFIRNKWGKLKSKLLGHEGR